MVEIWCSHLIVCTISGFWPFMQQSHANHMSHVKYNNVMPFIFLVTSITGDTGKLVASQHLHFGPTAGQQLSIGGEVDEVFFPAICSHPTVVRLKEMEAVASQSVPQSHLPIQVPGCQDVSFTWTELHLIDWWLVTSESVQWCRWGGRLHNDLLVIRGRSE